MTLNLSNSFPCHPLRLLRQELLPVDKFALAIVLLLMIAILASPAL